MHHEIKLDSRPEGSDQDIAASTTCPGCKKQGSLKWNNTGGQADREVLRCSCTCGDNVNIIIPGGLMGGGLAGLFRR